MRLVTWNCRVGGFRKKSERIARLRPLPDVLAVQEVEQIDSVPLFAGECQPTFRSRLIDPRYPKRGIGVFSYTNEVQLNAVDLAEPMHYFRRFEARRHDLAFNVVAVWPWQTKSVKTSYRQAHEGLVRFQDWIRERPTVILGDFNANARFEGNNWKDLVELLDAFGLVSAYHSDCKEKPGEERRGTHFHNGREDRPFHLDYCFVPEEWVSQIARVTVGTYADWHTVSDHVPVVVDLSL